MSSVECDSVEGSVPNTSFALNAASVPNNSLAAPSMGNKLTQMSQDQLSDSVNTIALYELFASPPSKSGDTAAAKEIFDCLDIRGDGTVIWRHVVHVLKPEDQGRYGSRHEPTKLVSMEEFLAFVEAVATGTQ